MQQGSGSTAILTDEQIVGLDPIPPANSAANVAQGADADFASGAEAFANAFADGDVNGDGSVARVARQETQADTDANPARDPRLFAAEENSSDAPTADRPEVDTASPATDPVWLKTLEAQPQGGREAAAEARAWRAAATDVAALDAGYFSADPSARAGLAARLYDSDPAAFRAMLAESARVVAQRDPQALSELARQLGAPQSPATSSTNPHSLRTAANQQPAPILSAAKDLSGEENQNHREILRRSAPQNDSVNASVAPAFPADAYRAFESATNDDVARRVHQAIDNTLLQTLPEGTAEGARRRIAADIFQEVQSSLSADRDLTRRVGETLRDWRFDSAARQQVASLLSGRARAVLPEVARRVVTEWTSSVLASDRARASRIEAASSRREVSGGRLPEPIAPGALRPRVDYRRMSDNQIMEL